MKKFLLNIVLLISICVFLFAGFNIVKIYYTEHKQDEEKTHLQIISKRPKNVKKEFKLDWKALKEVNEDIIGWIRIPDTTIDYPIVKGKDNTYYLNHSAGKSNYFGGAIFMDYQMDSNFKFLNTMIYGHSITNGEMFTDIKLFTDQEFYKNHPYLYIYTPEKNYRCEIFSMYGTKDTSKSYNLNYPNEASWGAYLDLIQNAAMFKTDVELNTKDHIVTLSTCNLDYGVNSDQRYLLHAKLVEWKDHRSDSKVTNQNA